MIRWGDGVLTPVTDAGSYAAGSSIRHALPFSFDGRPTGETFRRVAMAVDRVRLADGTVWEGPYGGSAPVNCAIYPGG